MEVDQSDSEQEAADQNNNKLVGKIRAKVSRHVSDPDAWGKVVVLPNLVDVVSHMENWFQACPCHSSTCLEQCMPKTWICPMKGRRAVCLASGGFDVLLENVKRASERQLLKDLPQDMSAEGRAQAIAQFTTGKSKVLTHAALRGRDYKRIPQRMLGVGHENNEVALAVLADCFLQCESVPEEERHNLHPTIQENLGEGVGRSEGLAALRAGNFAMSPFWEEWRAKSQFAYSLEVSVERLHAGITQDLSGIHHHGQAIISSGSRRLELDAVTSEKVGAQQIIEKLDTAYSGARCLQSLGMAAHPKGFAVCQSSRCGGSQIPRGIGTADYLQSRLPVSICQIEQP